jgi:hypothetical protein
LKKGYKKGYKGLQRATKRAKKGYEEIRRLQRTPKPKTILLGIWDLGIGIWEFTLLSCEPFAPANVQKRNAPTRPFP